MKRWQLTLMLGGLAPIAAVFAPVLMGSMTVRPELPPAVAGELHLSAGLDRSATLIGGPRERHLVVDIVAPAPSISKADTGDLVVVLDASGSMWAKSKMVHAKEAVRELWRASPSGTDLALVVFNDDAAVAVPPGVPISELEPLLNAVQEYGGTNLYAGLRVGRQVLSSMRTGNEPGQIVVVSDGQANVGVTDATAFDRLVETMAHDGVTVSAWGLGPDADVDGLARLAEVGGGDSGVLSDAQTLVDRLPAAHAHGGAVVARDLDVTVKPFPGAKFVGWTSPDADATDGVAHPRALRAGEARTVVADLLVDAALGDHTLLIELQYTDHQGVRRHQPTWATVNSVERSWEVEASVDRPRTEAATRHRAARTLTDGLRAGDNPQTLATDAADQLRSIADRENLPGLVDHAARLDDRPSTDTALFLQERIRDLLR
ncbi:MAG: vWA domain-containing protein [Myxococcota bacterium]